MYDVVKMKLQPIRKFGDNHLGGWCTVCLSTAGWRQYEENTFGRLCHNLVNLLELTSMVSRPCALQKQLHLRMRFYLQIDLYKDISDEFSITVNAREA